MLARSLRGILYFLAVVIIVSCSPFPNSSNTNTPLLNASTSLGANAPTSVTGPLYDQPVDSSGTLYLSSWLDPDGSDFDKYVWDSFTLQSNETITEIDWYGGYDPLSFGKGGAVIDFTLAIYSSTAGNTEPAVANPPLVEYQTGGNAGETPIGQVNGTPMYAYAFPLPAEFAVSAGVKYWVQIEAWQQGSSPDWGLASASGGNGSHYLRESGAGGDIRFRFATGDAAFALLGPVPATPTDILLDNTTVDENQPIDTMIGGLTAASPDPNATFTFSLTCVFAGTDDGFFNIFGTNLRTSAVFDYETKSVYNVCIRVTDQGGLTFDQNFVVMVNDLNETPTDLFLSFTTVDENQPVNTVVGVLSATDPDAGATFTFSLACTVAGSDDGSFNISGTNLRTSALFDYETKSTYQICIRVTDQGGLTLDNNFVLTVNDLNEAPTGIALSNATVNEKQPINTVVGALTAIDPDAGAIFTFSLTCKVAGADDVSFNISGSNLRTSESFVFETKSTYNLCIRVTDQGGLTFDKNFIITVNNVNEPPTSIALSKATVDEGQPINTLVGVLSATDPDAGATFTFRLGCAVVGADDSSFNILGTDLRTSATFIYETKSTYNICVSVTDQGGLAFDKNFIITVNNLNEAPTGISLSATVVDENQPVNTLVGALSATDPDAGATFTFSLACATVGADDGSFNILGTNLRTSAMFDYETKSTYSICVRVTDQGGLTFDKTFTVTINNLSENTAPTDISLSNTMVTENQPINTLVGALGATDPDAGATFTFSLACATAGADDGSFNILGTNLLTSAVFDYETKSAYNICIHVVDQGGLAFDKNFVVNVNNLNEAPTGISLTANSVDENQPVNTLVGALSASDPDAGASFIFGLACTVPGVDDGSFNILGTNLRTSAIFDFETKFTYNICVRVTDQGGLTFEKNFSITINNLSENTAPTDISLSNTTVTENQPINTLVGVLTATDPDAGATFTFSLACTAAGADDGSFNILGTNLRTSAIFDFETKSNYNICVRVTDQGGLSFDKNFVVNVNNLNEAPTGISLSAKAVDENQPANTIVGVLSASDPDAGSAFTFSLACAAAGADDGSFNILGTNLQTSAVFDYETKSTYDFCVRVTDQDGLFFDQNFVVTVNDVVEITNTPGKATGGGNIDLPNKKATFGFVIRYDAGDVNPSGNLTFMDHSEKLSLKASSFTLLYIDGNHARITGFATVNGSSNVSFTLDVYDYGEPGAADVFMIQIPDMNGYSTEGVITGGNIKIFYP